MKTETADRNFIVVCHNLRSAGNIGSIFRTAEGAGASQIILGGYCAPGSHPKVAKTALGAQKILRSRQVFATWRALQKLKTAGYQILALEKSANARNLFTFRPRPPLALVVGNEKRGLSAALRKYCDATLAIPMRGQKESLNVAVAFGIAIYHLIDKTKIHGKNSKIERAKKNRRN